MIIKINNRKRLQNIEINHSADIDYKDLIKIYREFIKELYSFLTIDTKLPASDPLRFRKKMIVTDQFKILDDKIKLNQAQYDLRREAAKVLRFHLNIFCRRLNT